MTIARFLIAVLLAEGAGLALLTRFGRERRSGPGMLGMGLLWAARHKLNGRFGDTDDHAMQIHGRIQLGQGSGLAVVEIATPDGPRMLLMGVGNGVPPQLVADLANPFRDELIDEILERGDT